MLLSERSKAVQDGGTWSTPGGAIEPGEDAWAAALRETLEEVSGLTEITGPDCAHESACECGWSYRTFPVQVCLIP